MNTNEEMVEYLTRLGYIKSDRVRKAFLSVDRARFVPPGYSRFAYADEPLPIGHGQTISAPSIIAEMLEYLDIRPGNNVLEIGTGSGYVTALLAELARPGIVYSIDVFPELVAQARDRLERWDNIRLAVADAWAFTSGEYDRMYFGCAPEVLPRRILGLLRGSGRAILPLGPRYNQRLVLVKKNKELDVIDLKVPVIFVPMVRKDEASSR